MGILLAAMAAAGDQAVKSIDGDEAQQNALDRLTLQSKLETQKALTVQQAQHDLTNEASNNAGDYLQAAKAQGVPLTAAPVTGLTGADPNSDYRDPTGAPTLGIKGDDTFVNGILAKARALPDSDPDKAGFLAQLQRQKGSDQDAANEAVEGQTREPTNAEAMQNAAAAAAKDGDFAAYNALRTAGNDRYIKMGEGDNIYDQTTNKMVTNNTSKLDRQMALEDLRNDRQNARLDSNERIAAARLEALVSKGGNDSTALIQNIKYLKSLGYDNQKIDNFIYDKKEASTSDIAVKLMSSDPLAGGPKALTMEGAVQKAISLQAALKASAGTAPPTPSGVPAGYAQIGTSGGKPVYQTPDGKQVIGK